MVAIAVAGVLVVGYIAKKQAAGAVDAVADAINPVNDQNIFNQGVLSIGRSITGNKSWTLGGTIYDWTH